MSDTQRAPVGRRTLLRGAGVGVAASTVLVACGSDDDSASSSSSTGSESGGSESTAPEGDGGSGGGGGSTSATTVSAADVPVQGGVVVEEKYVVTQPTKGDFKAFSAICTHMGCVVAGVKKNTITCACHGSTFDAETGEPTSGPNGSDPSTIKALASEPVAVDGDQIGVG